MTLAEGLAFLTSAMSWIGPGPARAARKSRTGGAAAAWSSISSSGIRSRAAATSPPLRRDDLVEDRWRLHGDSRSPPACPRPAPSIHQEEAERQDAVITARDRRGCGSMDHPRGIE